MENNIILTPEEQKLILKRRQKAAQAAKKEEDALKAVLDSLPTLSSFLSNIGVSRKLETRKEEKYQIHNMHATDNGFIGGGTYYSGSGKGIPVYEICFEKINKLCGRKIPFVCFLQVGVLNDKVVDFSIHVTDWNRFLYSSRELLGDSILQPCYRPTSDNQGMLLKADKINFKQIVFEQLKQYFIKVSTQIERNIQLSKQRYEEELQEYNEVKNLLGRNYQPELND